MFWLGNAASFIGCAIMVLIGFIKEKKRILAVQMVQFSFQTVGHLLLGATSGFVAGIVSILRNLVFARTGGMRFWKIVFVTLQVVLTFAAGWPGVISLLPLAAGILFTWFLDTKSEVVLKTVIILTQVLWGIYDFHYRNIAGFAFDILTVLSTVAGIALILKDKEHR